MNNVKFKLFIIILALIAVNGYSIDFGGTFGNTTSLNWEDDLTVSDKIKLSIWVAHQFNPNLDLLVKGSYALLIEQDEDLDHLPDLDRFVLNGEYPLYNVGSSLLTFSTGRFVFSDFTGNIIDHKLDGLRFGFDFPIMSVTAYTGYSGLLFSNTCNIDMTKSDDTDKNDEDEILGPKRLIEGIEFLFPELFLGQNLNVSFWAQQDFRNDNLVEEGDTAEEGSIGGKMSTQYTGLGVSGGVGAKFFYDSFFVIGTGKTLSYIDGEYEEANILSFLGGAGIRIYLKEALYSMINIEAVFSSGDSDSNSYFREGNTEDRAKMFVPISRTSPALVFSPALGNIMYLKAGYSLKPFSKTDSSVMQNFQAMATGIVFLRSTEGQISESGINAASDSLYLGTEVDIALNFRPFSDLGTALSVGLFFPASDGSSALAEQENKILGKFELSYSF